jgi:uncharacterized membrane protein YjjP (DUF1212 family)
MAALDTGRILMEAGANARSTEEVMQTVARGLGAQSVDLRLGYASLAITIVIGESGITRMRRVGTIGVNQELEQRVWDLAIKVSRRQFNVAQTRAELDRIARDTPRHAPWLTALAVGFACAAFGRLLGVDWLGIGPVLFASTIGQHLRRHLLAAQVNVFVCTTVVAYICSVLAGMGAHILHSDTCATAMVASILLLVPGVPAVNAQRDILDGHSTLGSARLATVIMLLVFLAAGLWFGQSTVGLLGQL